MSIHVTGGAESEELKVTELGHPGTPPAKRGWIEVSKRRPTFKKTPGGFGNPVLIWPHFEEAGASPSPIAFYGTRYGNGKTPVFYIYGREVFPTHWQPLPEGPAGTSNPQGSRR